MGRENPGLARADANQRGGREVSWLFPLYLAGAAAVLAPILLHLRRQPPKDRVPFSSLMFLEETERQPTRRRRLEHWLLLLLRCLVLLALAVMFSRPLWRTGTASDVPEGAEAVVVLVDRSASMRRADLWDQALAAVGEVVAKAGLEDRVAVGAFDSRLRSLWSFEEDGAAAGSSRGVMVAGRLKEIGVGWGGTETGAALVKSLSWLETPGLPPRRRVVLVSDFQESTRLEPLRSMVWPENLPVERRVVGLGTDDPGNLTLEWVGTRDEEGESAGADKARAAAARGQRKVRVRSAVGTPDTTFELAWESADGQRLGGNDRVVVQGFVTGGATRVLEAPPLDISGKEGFTEGAVLRLTGDRFDFDNRVYLAPEKPREVAVWVAGQELDATEASAPAFYLKRVLQPTAAIRPVMRVVNAGQWNLPGSSATRPQVLVLPGNGAPIHPDDAAAWRRELEGGAVGIVVADGEAEASFLKALAPETSWSIAAEETEPGGYAMLGELNSAHPLLTPFSDGRLQDFSKVRFWRHRRVGFGAGDGVTVLARFDQGDPALMTVRVGSGHLLVLASGWHPADSQLALSTKFVPLWFGWLAAAGYAHQEPASFAVGEAIPLRLNAPGMLVGPKDQTRIVVEGEPLAVEEPGLYKLTERATDSPQSPGGRVFAVQVSGAEGRVTVMPEAKFEEAGVRLVEAVADQPLTVALDERAQERLDRVTEEAQQRGWWWLLLALLALGLGESWLAGRRASPKTA